VTGEPTFEIPAWPDRRFSRSTVEYEGTVLFALAPTDPPDDGEVHALLGRVLEEGPYRYGDWFDLPMPLYLVHDDDTGDTFRVAVRDGTVELHVLPATESAGLRAIYDRLVAASDSAWAVECRTDG
jgi:hypothetical protein